MNDQTTKVPLRVSVDAYVGPYIRLPESQLDDVCQILDRHGIHYRVKENRVSINGGPFMAMIYLGRRGNAEAVQTILDSAI